LQEKAHLKVCELARDAMPEEHRQFVAMLWEGIEAGATRPDDFRMLLGPDEGAGVARRAAAHRCYVDSDDPKDQVCPAQVSRYATGAVSLIERFAEGELEGAHDGARFRRGCGALLGVIAHHAADLWTPVHLGRSLQTSDLHHRHRRGFHFGVEADLEKAAAAIGEPLEYRPQQVPLDAGHYARLASRLYRRLYLMLPVIYGKSRSGEGVHRLAHQCIVGAACTTADIWATVAASSPVDQALQRIEASGS